jgi:hypothetical protein
MARVNKLYEKPLITSIALTDKVTVGQLVNGEYKVKTMLYSDFLAQIVDDTLVLVVTRAQLQALITASSLAIGVRYIITNAVGSTLSLLIQAVSPTVLDEIAVNTTDGENYKYNIVTDTAILISNPIALGTANQLLGVNAGATAQEYKTVQGTANRVSVNHTANAITITTPQDIATTSNVEFAKLNLNNIIPLEDEFAIIGQAINDSIGTVDNAYFISSLDLLTNAVADATYLTTIDGISAGGELEGNYASPTLKNSSVVGKVLTGLSVTGSAVVSTDSVLAAIGKLQNQVNGLAGGVEYQGTWNASTNTPTLTSSVGTQGFYYVVSVAGSTNLDGITTWELGDWAIFNGATYQKVDNTDAVVSVNGYTGIVTLSAADVSAVPTSAISGTSGTVALFGASNTLGDSVITQSGGRVTIDGDFRVAGADANINLQGTSKNYLLQVVDSNNRFRIYDNTANAERFSISSGGSIITANATDTGEHFIIGGSARVNGAITGNSSLSIGGVITSGNLIKSVSNGASFQLQSYDNNGGYIDFSPNTGGSYGYIGSAYHLLGSPYNIPTNLAIRAEADLILTSGGSTPRLIIANSGAATFSSSVTVNGSTIIGGTTSSGTNINLYASSYGSNGLFNSYGTDGNLKFQAGALGLNEAFIYAPTSAKLSIFSGGVLALELASNQAATFSSSVAIGNTVTAAIGVASTHKVTMVIGGVTYYLLATT